MNAEFEVFCDKKFESVFLKESELKKTNFKEGLKYSFFSGGKRVRPYLMFMMADHFKLKKENIYPAAFALECIHTYSLIHDDLPCMDDDDIRRGKPTHHIKFGEAHAVLSGDALLTLAFEVLADSYSGHALKELVLSLSKCAGSFGMVGGQVLDCLTKKRSLEIFKEIHYLKTAKLFEFAFLAPAVLGENDEKVVESSVKLGAEIGLMFQLQDDLLDIDKKNDREEENISSLVSVDELKQMISDKKKYILSLLKDLDFNSNSNLHQFLDKLYARKA